MSTNPELSNVWPVVRETDLKASLGRVGQVEAVQIAPDLATRRSRGFAIFAMLNDVEASAAIARLNCAQYAGRSIGESPPRANWS